jgi:hypothetical protein
MPYSDETGWLSQQEWNDHATFCRAMGKPVPVSHEPGTPAPELQRATAAQKPQAKAAEQATGYFDRATGRVLPFTDEMRETRKVTAKGAGNFMRACASSTVRDLRSKDIVSYVVPHEESDKIHVGRIVDADPHSATVEIQEHQPSADREGWTPVGTSGSGSSRSASLQDRSCRLIHR